jgi:aminopeptidase YwaD
MRQMTSQMGYEPGKDLAAFGLQIPGVIVSREDGERLLSLLSAGRVEARIEHRSSVELRSSRNVIGYQWGKGPDKQKVLIGAHYDTQYGLQGAWDNASGCAALLEIARVLAGSAARRTRIFCAFGGEEIGLFGSTAFVRRRVGELESFLAYFNLDSTSGDVPYTHELQTTRRLGEFARELVAAHSDWRITSFREFTPLDHEQDSAEFVRQGVEAFWAHEEGNAFFHTVYDSLDTVDSAKLARATRAALLPFHYLAQAELVSF